MPTGKRVALTVPAVGLLMLLLGGCSTNRAVGPETNVAFNFDRNQLVLDGASLSGEPGKFLIATAAPRSLVDADFATGASLRPTLRLSSHFKVTLDPARYELGNLADALVGFDVWKRWTIAVDYRKRLLTLIDGALERTDLARFPFSGLPALPVLIDDQHYSAIVDTALPDNLLLPLSLNPAGPVSGRGTVSLIMAGRRFDHVDVAYGATSSVRIGNRMLSNFLLFIDYPEQWVGLWYDSRPRAGIGAGGKTASTSDAAAVTGRAGD